MKHAADTNYDNRKAINSGTPQQSGFSKYSRKLIQRAIEDGRVVSVFVEKIPSGWQSSDLYRELSKAGTVMDVFIPGKLSRNGIRFGFVKFENRGGVTTIIDYINKSCNGMLHANIAKNRSWKSTPGNSSRPDKHYTLARSSGGRAEHVKEDTMDRRRRFLVGKRTDARTFAQVTDYRARVTEAAPAANDNKGFSFVFTPTSDCINRLKACAFGMVKDNIPIDEIARGFTMISNSQIRIKRLGGVYVLVDFGSKDAMDACVSHKDAWFSEFFDMFREWKQGDCATHRECILNVHGVPPQAWNEDFFRLIAVRFGSFIKLHNSFDRSDYLEMAKVSIITTCRQPISRTFKVLINGLEYEVSAVEVQQPPMEEASWCVGCSSSSANGSEKVEESRRGSDTDESNSPDPFGIRDAIKNLAKGKSALVIEPA
ncbi:hypothetical protein Tsubulata_002994 [Turnera subulata]|uniref:RRM domain-containing protein n=1 Tax=Turnera subulata TaxID=218843 RepID=A0A9Q0G182_9ROSI|nr:hypothetical protein Tsubulata_002994 [Turnera subulata]